MGKHVEHQNYVIKKDTRFVINSAVASMGYAYSCYLRLYTVQRYVICEERQKR